ncbi:sodium-dependent transporter [Parvularcula sp. IMCC14364]|uniref:sodium-dependent transporter n=1 Tax=Parvularcula sp. IMCC14364 TaxID=3067902 RepID=UPI002740558B|nr:sodium-dependent transporter [Parvularcula sp. IMCC14364]
MAGVSKASGQENWSSRAAFILAAIGSAVGLGNLWRFPYVAGESGGGAFVLIYILCIVLIGLPVLCAELMIGRRGGGSAISAVTRLARTEGHPALWGTFAGLGILASFLILSFYCMIAGWVLYYVIAILGDLFSNIASNGLGAISAGAFESSTPEEISGRLGALLARPGEAIIYQGIFVLLTIGIVSRGISGGIEKAVTILMPAFFVMLLILVVVALVQGDGTAAVNYLFKPDFAALAAGIADRSILSNALGQAFFSIGLGSALMITYGMYMSKDADVPGSAAIVCSADTIVALIAGLAIFPIVFQFGLEPGGGPGLMFGTLPLAFQQMPFGAVFGAVFFLMALFAALTSSISLLEPAVAWRDGGADLAPEAKMKRRLLASIGLGGILFALGVMHILSQVPTGQANFFNSWVPVDFGPFAGKTFFDFVDVLTSQFLLPIVALLTAIFAGWVVSKTASREELGFKTESRYRAWYFLIRFVCPAAIFLIVLTSLGIL